MAAPLNLEALAKAKAALQKQKELSERLKKLPQVSGALNFPFTKAYPDVFSIRVGAQIPIQMFHYFVKKVMLLSKQCVTTSRATNC